MSLKAPPRFPAWPFTPSANRRGREARQVAALDTGIAPRLATRNNRSSLATFCRPLSAGAGLSS